MVPAPIPATLSPVTTDRWSNSAVELAPLPGADGKSGAVIQRAVLPGGDVVVLKHVDPTADWVMQAAGDTGRILSIYEAGVFDRLPDGVDAAIVGVEPTDAGVVVAMRDVSAAILPDGTKLTRAQGRRLLGGVAAVHRTFLGADPSALGDLFDLAGLYRFLSPASARQMRTNENIPELIVSGWERFLELVPADVADAIRSVHERPALLADAMAGHDFTVVHGDAKVANLGLEGDTVVMLDWGALTSWAPPAVEYAYHLAVNGAAIDASLDELLDDVNHESIMGPSDPALPLALFGAVVQLGWDKGLSATGDDEDANRIERAGIDWWVERCREALDRWSPAA